MPVVVTVEKDLTKFRIFYFFTARARTSLSYPPLISFIKYNTEKYDKILGIDNN